MDINAIFSIALIYFLYSIQSHRFENTMFTPPMLFMLLGLILSRYGIDLIPISISINVIHIIAEATLILVLFIDASHIDFEKLKYEKALPSRLLFIGLPLSILLGTSVAILLFPSIGIFQALIIALVLAPTDAALGQTVVSHISVPLRIRQTLNVESGLNDGIVLPMILIAAYAASLMIGGEERNWLSFVAYQLIFGPLTGLIVGITGAKLLTWAVKRNSISEVSVGLSTLGIAFSAYTGAELIHGNGFISAFIAGLFFGNHFKLSTPFYFQFAETQSHLLTTFTFLMFGAVLFPSVLPLLQTMHFLYAILSLTVIRMLATSLSLMGSGVKPITHFFLGWFGPRGLASVLFALLILKDSSIANKEEILIITFLTVALSVILHGLTAAPWAKLYGKLLADSKNIAEAKQVQIMPYEKFKDKN